MTADLLRMDDYLAKSLARSPRANDAGPATQAIDQAVLTSLDETWEEGEPDLVVELIDLAPVRLGEIVPAHFLDNHLMTQTIGLLHLVTIKSFVFGSYNVNH